MLVGRAHELERLARGLVEVPVAVICGLPGTGRSTLAAAHAATWPGPGPAMVLELTAGASIAHLAETVHRRLGAARGELAADDAAQLEALWALLDDLAALLVLDDLHCLAPDARSLVVETAARRLHAGRLIATSRELVPIGAGTPDRMQLRLDGLDRGDAAQLWERLVELYGPAGDFEAAWQRSRGNPALLRRAHVALRSDDEPLRALVQTLGPEHRRIAGVLALGYVALPRGLVLGLALRLGADPAVVDDLVHRLILDATDAGYAMHDLVREAVVAELDAGVRDELRAALIEALPDSELDIAAILGESARHLRALGRHAEVTALLLSAGARLIRRGDTAVLLDEILADDDPNASGWLSHDVPVPPTRRGAFVRAQVRAVLRAACSGEAPRVQPHLDVAIPVSADYAFDRALLDLARAVLATRHGRARRAAKHLRAAASHAAECRADPRLVPALYEVLRSRAAAAGRDDAAAPQPALVIDGTRHEILDGSVRVALTSRIVLRRLLYAFVTAEANYLDRAGIARALWAGDYVPLRHNSSIKSNVKRLRDLLQGTRVVIQTDQDGYRLVVPPGSVLVPPAP
ncbi:MAG TPA: hypothetical protein VGD37_37935 [Kofleriaceae bacterium]|jgi:hypothetical protein